MFDLGPGTSKTVTDEWLRTVSWEDFRGVLQVRACRHACTGVHARVCAWCVCVAL